MESTPRILGESRGLRIMMKKILFGGTTRRCPTELEEIVENLITKASLDEGPQVALISQNWGVAYAMLRQLLENGVNVTNVLLRDEKSFQRTHVKSYTNQCSMQMIMQSMGSGGIEYFIVMALNDKIPPKVVETFHGRLWNVHGSLLPEYMGAGNPVWKQLRYGEEYGGVTVQYVGKEIDSGDVLVRYKVPLIYEGERYPLENPPRKLVNKNYRKVIFPTAAEVCAFALKHIDRIRPMPVERLRGGSRLSPNKMVYTRK